MTLPEGVTEKDVRRYSKLAGVTKALNKKHGVGKWGDAEVAAYIKESKAKKLHALEHPPARPMPSWVPPETFQKRVDEYLAVYDNVTPNDRQSVYTLVTIELNLDRIRSDLLIETDPIARQKLSETLTTLSREHRQLQDGLGIGRAKRKSEASAQDEIEKLRAGAARFLATHTTPIKCAHCRTTVNMGFVAFHFRDEVPWQFRANCPKCGGEIDHQGAVRLVEPPVEVFKIP